jgi:hypothetical protein
MCRLHHAPKLRGKQVEKQVIVMDLENMVYSLDTRQENLLFLLLFF